MMFCDSYELMILLQKVKARYAKNLNSIPVTNNLHKLATDGNRKMLNDKNKWNALRAKTS